MNAKLKWALVALVIIAGAAGFFSIVAQKTVAPAVTFRLHQGGELALSGLRGKVVLVNFWATSCATCIKEMPALIETHHKFQPRGYETVAVAMQYDKPDFVTAYTLKNNLPFQVAYDHDGAAARAFADIRLTPTTFLIDKQGFIVKRILGEPDFAQLHQEIEALLNAPAA